MPNPKFRVDPPALNLRIQPIVEPQTRLALLPQGHEVEKLEEAADPEWWRVGTVLGGVGVEGFVVHRGLVPVALHVPQPASSGPGPVHLRETAPT